jgi:hypothetical protein
VLSVLVSLESDSSSSEDLAVKCRRALKSIIAKLTHLPALDALVHMNMAENIMKIVLEQVRGLRVQRAHMVCCISSEACMIRHRLYAASVPYTCKRW